MLKKVEGLIIKAIKYSETSVICDAYTAELGRRTYIINGVRKKNSRISPALVKPMSLVEMIVYHHEEKDINRIKEIKPSYIYQRLPFDVARGAIGLFVTEVAQKTLREPEPNPVLYEFLVACYQKLDQTEEKIVNFPIWFLVKLSTYLGLFSVAKNLSEDCVFDYSEGKILREIPSGHHYYFSSQNTHLLAAFLELDFETSAQLELSNQDRRDFMDDMLRYYQYHIDNFGELNSILVLKTVFS
jgi:DNA repair protein RecO (recombination protein O)